jgi:hypothetical protein
MVYLRWSQNLVGGAEMPCEFLAETAGLLVQIPMAILPPRNTKQSSDHYKASLLTVALPSTKCGTVFWWWRFYLPRTVNWSRGSSGSIVSDYGLDDRVIEVRFPTGAEDFSSSLCVQTGSGAHPASCPMGTGGSFPGSKARPERDADHSPPSSGRG